MRSVSYEIASPENADPVDVIFMPNIMGGALHFPIHEQGDHLYRADYMAHTLMSHIVAYERPGTGRTVFDMGAHSAVQPDEYVRSAAKRASELQQVADSLDVRQAIILGASAGGTDVIALAQSENLKLDAVAVYDPIGVRETSWSGGFRDWAKHQKLEGQRPEQLRNQHPMVSPGQPLATIHTIAGVARTAVEMYHYGNMWRHAKAYEGLRQLVSDERFGHIALLGEFPATTFTEATANMDLLVQTLNAHTMDSTRTAAAEFTLVQKNHSWTDDPANLAEFGRRAQELLA